jgi:prevent-host-death family protein
MWIRREITAGGAVMRKASLADAKANLADYLQPGGEGPVIVTRNGKPVGVIVAFEDEDDLERLLMGYSPKLRAIFDAGEKQIRTQGGIPHDEFWRKVESQAAAKAVKGKPRRSKSPQR